MSFSVVRQHPGTNEQRPLAFSPRHQVQMFTRRRVSCQSVSEPQRRLLRHRSKHEYRPSPAPPAGRLCLSGRRRCLRTFVCICKYKFPTVRDCVSPQAVRALNAAEALGAAQVLSAARCFNFECVVTFPGQLVFSPCSFYCRGTAAQHTTHNLSRAVGCSHAPPTLSHSHLVVFSRYL